MYHSCTNRTFESLLLVPVSITWKVNKSPLVGAAPVSEYLTQLPCAPMKTLSTSQVMMQSLPLSLRLRAGWAGAGLPYYPRYLTLLTLFMFFSRHLVLHFTHSCFTGPRLECTKATFLLEDLILRLSPPARRVEHSGITSAV